MNSGTHTNHDCSKMSVRIADPNIFCFERLPSLKWKKKISEQILRLTHRDINITVFMAIEKQRIDEKKVLEMYKGLALKAVSRIPQYNSVFLSTD